MGDLHFHNSGGFALSQSHYVDKILKKYQHLNVKDTSTPFDFNFKLYENVSNPIAQLEYASVIEILTYAMSCTRPDISYSVCRLVRYIKNSSKYHWKAVTRIFGYLKRIKDLDLLYNNFSSVLEGNTDVRWVTSIGDQNPTSRWIFMQCASLLVKIFSLL